jgi:cell wall-associated NlpC family hydrolase
MRDLSKYIGRSYNTYNCFDCAKHFYHDELGLDLKNYFDGAIVPDRKEIECLVITNKGDFVKVDKPEFGDIIVIRLYGYASHIGIYVGEGRFLHSLRDVGSCIDVLSRYEKMVEGYYRHQELAQ